MKHMPVLLGLLSIPVATLGFAETSGGTAPSSPTPLGEIAVEGDSRHDVMQPIGPRPTMPESLPTQVQQTTSVVNRAEIERSNASSVTELLQGMPNVGISRKGGLNSTVVIRGMDTLDVRVPVFIDGDRFRGRSLMQMMMVAPYEVEQIEVVRGSASYMYGSDALGGLINIVTRRPSGNPNGPWRFAGGDAFMMYDTNGDGLQGGVSISAMGQGFDLSLSVNGRTSNNYRSGEGTIENSDYESGGGAIVLGYSPTDNQRAEASFRVASVSDGRASAQPAPALQIREAPLQVYTGRIAYQGDYTDSFLSHFEASLFRSEYYTKLSIHNEVMPQRTMDARTYVNGPVNWGGRVAGTIPWHTLSTTVGADFHYETGFKRESAAHVEMRNPAGAVIATVDVPRAQFAPNGSQLNIGTFVNSSWNPDPKWTVTGAGRFDWFLSDVNTDPIADPALRPALEAAQNTTANATTGSVGLAYRPVQMVELVANIGTSFRYPFQSEMFIQDYSDGVYTLPNPELKPERGINYEAGARLYLQNATIRLTGFYNEYRDFMMSVPTTYRGEAAVQQRNVGRAEIIGIEADWQWQITPSLNFFGGIAALRATNTTTDLPVPYIAPLSGRLGLQYALPNTGIAFGGVLNWGASKTRIDPAMEFETGGYAILNLNAEFKLDQLVSSRLGNTTLILGLNNLFDTSYRSAATAANTMFRESDTNPLLEPGRSLTVALHTRF